MIKLHSLRIPYWAYLLLIMTFVVIVFYIYARFQIPIDGIGSKLENGRTIITAVAKDSPADKSGLIPGDVITHVNNMAAKGNGHLNVLESYRAGDYISYTVQRGNKEFEVTMKLSSLWSQHPWLNFVLYSLILVVCTTSILILYVKPYDFSARLFFIFIQLLAIAQNSKFLFLEDSYALIANIAFIFSYNLYGVVLLHFHLHFPNSVSFDKKNLIKVFYSIGLLFGIMVSVMLILRNYTPSGEVFSLFTSVRRWSLAWMGLTLSLALVVALFQFNTARTTISRKRLRLVVIGSALGLVVPIIYGIYPEFVWRMEIERHLLSLIEFSSGLGTYIMTSILAVAIFSFRIWNIELFIRKAILYGTATFIVYITYIVLLFLVDKFLVKESSVVHFIILTVAISMFLLLRDSVQNAIDRFFYREPYDPTKVVAKFEDKIAGIYKVDELKLTIAQCLDETFHFKTFIVAQRENEKSYRTVFASGISQDAENIVFEISEEIDSLLRKSNIFAVEQLMRKPKIFELSKGELIIPLMNGNLPTGFFILGPKRSERSYSLQDIKVLSLLARRIDSVFHTAQLYQKDIERKEVLDCERKRIAKDIHDDIGASMTRLHLLSEMAKNNPADAVKTKQWLEQISETSDKVMQGMNQIVWALDPKNESFEDVIAYIRRYTMEYLDPTPINCYFNLPEEIPDIQLNIQERRNIYLCFRESLNNMIKHSGAKNVYILIKKTSTHFTIEIKDDGEGFDPKAHEVSGNGLTNMKKRMKDIGGRIEISSEIGKGTEMTLTIPTKSKQ